MQDQELERAGRSPPARYLLLEYQRQAVDARFAFVAELDLLRQESGRRGDAEPLLASEGKRGIFCERFESLGTGGALSAL